MQSISTSELATIFEPKSTLQPDDLKVGDWFGFKLALSEDLLVVGAPAKDATERVGTELAGVGAIYVYRLHEGHWLLEDQVLGPDAVFGNFGSSVALSGNVIAAAAPASPGCDGGVGIFFRGSVHIVAPRDGKWVPEQCLSPRPRGSTDGFGLSLDLSGSRLVVGAPFDSSLFVLNGAAYLFERDTTGKWIDIHMFTAPNPDERDDFGGGVALGPGFVLVGAPFEKGSKRGPVPEPGDNSLLAAGAAYVFKEE